MIDTTKEARRLAQAHINRMQIAGVTASAAQRTAVADLTAALTAIGISKFVAVYPLIGSTAAAHALDLLGVYDITWSGTITHDGEGSKGDGSSGYGNTGIDQTAEISATDGHIAAKVTGDTYGGTKAYVGAGTTSDDLSFLGFGDVGTKEAGGIALSNTAPDEYAPDDADGDASHDHFHGIDVTTSQVQQYYRDGVATGATVSATGSLSALDVHLMSRNNGSPGLYTDATIHFVSIGAHLTAGEWASLDAAVDQLHSTLSRA